MTAHLGMYDLPPIQGANDRFWAGIRGALGFGPEHLNREDDVWQIWTDPDLVLAQTCGMPYRTRLHGKVSLVATPDYGLPGCPPGHYNSVLVMRQDDPRALDALKGARFAYNEALSQSGWAAPMTHLRAQGLEFDKLLATGGHIHSARAVADGRADLAGLDALTWDLLCEHDPVATQLRVVERTTPTPTLPYITALGRDAGQIANAVQSAIHDMDDEDRKTLHLRGLVQIPPEDYLRVPTPPPPA